MNGYVLEEGRLGDLPTAILSSRVSGALLEVALRGATPLHWRPVVDGTPIEVLDGYVDEAELIRQEGTHNAVMAPWSNRIADATYTFDGRTHRLLPSGSGPAIHGLLREIDCDLVDVELGQDDARLVLATRAIRLGAFAGYPFALDVKVTFTLTDDRLTLQVSGHNTGEDPAPFAAGWHPYFHLTGRPVDDLVLYVPARRVIRTDDQLIPLAGDDAFADAAGGPVDFTAPRPIGSTSLDHAFAGLEPHEPTVLHDPASGRAVEMTQDRGLVQIFTGDTLDRSPRASIAIEPLEAMTNAFDRPDCHDAIRLQPGATRSFRASTRVFTRR
jgi:aldose 1-epimerase